MSFLKKLMKKKDEEQRPHGGTAPTGVQTMSAELQLKYAKGVQYNMKVIIKGDRNVGKSTLFLRLQGQKFREEYLPTDEIQVANIQWNYKTTDDVVKVEVWDVVDKARRKPASDAGLKMKHEQAEDDSPKLDAQFVDVYKGTHAVILMYDMTKMWTWQYVEQEIHKVPAHIPVIILANNRDMGQHRTVDIDTTRYFVSSLDRGEGGAPVRFTESSLLNGFGLKYLHAFFNVPFLILQRETLLRQLEANSRETAAIQQELDMLGEAEYGRAVEAGKIRRAGAANSTAAMQQQAASIGSVQPATLPLVNSGNSKAKPNQSVDDFQPDVADALDFFGSEDTKQSNRKKPIAKQTTSDEDDEADGNPMVASFQDDLDSGDDDLGPAVDSTGRSSKPAAGKVASADVILSSDEEIQEEPAESDSESDSEPVVHHSINKLTEQFNQVVVGDSGSKATLSKGHQSDSSEESPDEVETPAILADEDSLSDSANHRAGKKSPGVLPSSRDVVLTDSDDEGNRPAVMSTERVSSDEEHMTPASTVQLPDIAISHQTNIDSSERKPVKKKKKKKEKTTAAGEDDSKPKKKKKSKVSDGEGGKERKKKSKSKSASSGGSKPALDPLEMFLAGDSDDNTGKPSQYECL